MITQGLSDFLDSTNEVVGQINVGAKVGAFLCMS